MCMCQWSAAARWRFGAQVCSIGIGLGVIFILACFPQPPWGSGTIWALSGPADTQGWKHWIPTLDQLQDLTHSSLPHFTKQHQTNQYIKTHTRARVCEICDFILSRSENWSHTLHPPFYIKNTWKYHHFIYLTKFHYNLPLNTKALL